MDDRKETIEIAINLICEICKAADISLISKEVCGVHCAVVQDDGNGKCYSLAKE